MNTQTKHTPGPWEVVGSRICTVGNDRERVTLAKTEPSGAFTMSTEQTANARLIAAAPAMYTLIKDMREAFYVKGTRKALLAVMERSHEIMAQAEGK